MPNDYNDDDYNDFFKRIKDYLNIDPEKFDFDIIFMPESNLGQDIQPENENMKGFKVTYHFEKGMDKPEIRIEGDFDKEKLQNYFKKLNITNYPQLGSYLKRQNSKVLEGKSLTLQPRQEQPVIEKKDPYYELNLTAIGAEIVMEVPGVEKGHVILSIGENEKNLKLIIHNNLNEFEKIIKLPFEFTLENHNLEIKNGIISIQIRKKNK